MRSISQKYSIQKKAIAYSCLVILCLLMFACQSKGSIKTLKLAHALNEDHPVHLGIVEMGRLLEVYSKGKMRLKIFSNGQLGQERDLLELIQIGSLDITKVSANTLENFVPQYKVFITPYVFRNAAHTWNILEGPIGKDILAQGEKFKLRGLCYFDAGNRSFYSTKKPIYSPADLKGLKIRVMNSQSSFDMVNALGGSPTPISFGELYTALQQGVVDAAENNPPSFYTSKHYEVCKYYTIDEHLTVPDVIIVGTYLWNSLSAEEKKWLQQAANDASKYQQKIWNASVKESLSKIEAAGVKIIHPEKSLFQNEVQSLYETYNSQPELKQLIDKIQATQTSETEKPNHISKTKPYHEKQN